MDNNEIDINEKYSDFLTYVGSERYNREEKVEFTKTLFNDFDDLGKLDSQVDEYAIDTYGSNRSYGLERETSARIAGISANIDELLEGVGLSLERFETLVLVETTATERLIADMYAEVVKAARKGDVSAALQMIDRLTKGGNGTGDADKLKLYIDFSHED